MKRKCFIIMPFSSTKTVKKEDWDKIYEDFFLPAWSKVDFECERTNVTRGSITKDIIEKCFAANLVMADLTNTNPNVMYELGLRHTFKKPSIMVKQKDCKIPFDVNDYKVHEYENTATGFKEFKELIKDVVNDLDNNPEKPDNPVWDLIRSGGFLIDYYNRIETINKLEALIYELELNNNTFQEFRLKFDKNQKSMKMTDVGILVISIQIDCLSLLISTRYNNFNDEEWETITKLQAISNSLIRSGAAMLPHTINDLPTNFTDVVIAYQELIIEVKLIIKKYVDNISSLNY